MTVRRPEVSVRLLRETVAPVNFNDPAGLAKCTVTGVHEMLGLSDDTRAAEAEIQCTSAGGTITVWGGYVPMPGSIGQLENDWEASVGKQIDFMECENNEAAYLKKYLSKYGSPLADYALAIVQASDAQGLDDRFIVALAGVESRYLGGHPKPANEGQLKTGQ